MRWKPPRHRTTYKEWREKQDEVEWTELVAQQRSGVANARVVRAGRRS